MIFFTEGDAWTDISFTFRSTILGFIIGTTTGSLFGLSFWWSRNYAAIAQPYIICFESMPKLALAPLVILVFGLGLVSKVVIAIALTFVISTLTAFAGVKALDPDGEKLFYSLGATRWQVFRKLVVPFCLPWIISVLRVNIGLALTGAIVGEFIASQHGLGRAIFYAGPTYDIALVWVAVFVLSALAIVMYAAVSWLEERAAQRHTSVAIVNRRLAWTDANSSAPPRRPARRSIAKPYIARAAKHELLVAEPVHSTGYLPMYIAMAKDYFAEADINVKIVTIETGVRPHQRGAVRPGLRLHRRARAQRLRQGQGRRAARGRALRRPRQRLFLRRQGPAAGRPRLHLLRQGQGDRHRRLRRHAELDHPLSAEEVEARRQERRHPGGDRQLGHPRRRPGQASPARLLDRTVHHAGREAIGIWSEPFFNVPKELGPYAYSTINIRLDSIKKEPEVVKGFVRGMMKGLKFLYADKAGSAEIAKKQFPTMPLEDLKATLDRSFADEMWSKDGMISRAGLGHRQGRGDGRRHSQDRRQV